jgi:filamentous hemagglutinin
LLATVASALNDKNLPLAQIAAVHLRLPDFPDLITRASVEAEDLLIKSRQVSDWHETEHPRAGAPPNPGWFAPKPSSDTQSRPMQTAQGRREEREPEETLDPMAPVRRAVWDARIALLRRIDPNNPNLTYFANPSSPPSQDALDRLDAEVTAATARVANTIANGHAFAHHAAEFPEVSGKSQFAGVIQRVISNPNSLVKPLSDGRTAFYEETTNSLVIVDPKRTDAGTAFRPSDGVNYVYRLR